MQKSESLNDLIDIVKSLGEIYREENLRVDIDFDPNDGMTMVKYEDTNTGKKTIFINSNNKTISGIDTSKFWLPDYSNIQKANKKVIRLLEDKGYIVANLTYRNTQKSEE
jgi:HKD family nuclease